MASPSPPAFDVQGTIGALELGVFLACVLFGLETMQAYMYFCRYTNDSFKMRALVATVWLLEFSHLVSISKALYAVSVTDYGNPQQSLRPPTALAVSLFFSGIILAFVQGFFALRVYRSSRAVLVPMSCGTLTFVRLIGFTALFALTLRVRNSSVNWAAKYTWLWDSVWAVSSANDILLASAVSYLLFRQRAESKSQRVISKVDQVVEWTVETGALTSVTGLVVLITFITVKNKYIWIASYFVTAKLYANAFFATLNSRPRPHSSDNFSDRDVILSDINSPELKDNPRAQLAPMEFAPMPPPNQSQISDSHSFSFDADEQLRAP